MSFLYPLYHHYTWNIGTTFVQFSFVVLQQKNRKERKQILVLGSFHSYFVWEQSEAKVKCIKKNSIYMIEILVDIFVKFGDRCSHSLLANQWAPIVIHCWLICTCTHMRLSSCRLTTIGAEHDTTRSFDFTLRYKDDVLRLYNPDIDNYPRINYLYEVKIQDTPNTDSPASYFGFVLGNWQHWHAKDPTIW